MNKIIRRFKIEGLFGYKTFDSGFGKRTTIFIGENGMGKTTVMSILFYLLKGDLLELLHYSFDSVSIFYSDNISFTLKYEDIETYIDNKRNDSRLPTFRRTIRYIKNSVPENLIKESIDEYNQITVQMKL